ncbi:MAG: AsmA family protein [Pseudomonadota bacterium]
MKKNSTLFAIGGGCFAAVVGLIVLFALFDWNTMRPYINRSVSEATGRQFAILGKLDLQLRSGVDAESGWRRYMPILHISAQDIRMSNPSWSTVGGEMAAAKRVDVALQILPLLSNQFIVTDLRLDGLRVALQRRKDGGNSWTLKQNGRSKWTLDLRRLAFTSGTLRYRDDVIGLDVHAEAESIDGARLPAAPGVEPYGVAFTLGGTYNKAPVTGSGKTGAVLTLKDAHTSFPLEAHADIGGNQIALRGTLIDPTAPSGMAMYMKLAGPSMAELYPLTGVLLPATPPYETHGRLLGTMIDHAPWSFTYDKFSGKIGASDIGGTLIYSQRRTRPLLRGELKSQQLRLADMGPTVGAATGSGTRRAGLVKAAPAGKTLPIGPFNAEHWDALDVDVKFSGERIVGSNGSPLHKISVDVHMKDKVLQLTQLDFGMAGGQIVANIVLDGRQKIIHTQARVAARHLKIRELLPKLQSTQASFGEINGDAVLIGDGNTVAAILAGADGDLEAVVTEGSVSKFMLEMAGLNVANALAAKLFGDKQVKMRCLVAQAVLRHGRADVRRFVLDTDDAVIDVSGYVDLAQERFDLDVHPKTKGSRIFTLRTPLYARGTFAHPEVGPRKGPIAIKAGAAVALATVFPFAALLPLANVGKVPDTDCAGAIAAARKPPATQAPGVAKPAKK